MPSSFLRSWALWRTVLPWQLWHLAQRKCLGRVLDCLMEMWIICFCSACDDFSYWAESWFDSFKDHIFTCCVGYSLNTMTSPPLYVGSLKVPSDSLTIGPAHKQVLKEKRDQMEQELFRRRAELAGRLPTDLSRAQSGSLSSTLHPGQPNTRQKKLDSLYQEYQSQLDKLYDRFQREWTSNPHEKGKKSTL